MEPRLSSNWAGLRLLTHTSCCKLVKKPILCTHKSARSASLIADVGQVYDNILHITLWSSQVYIELRKSAAASHGMPIAVRHLESLIRMSEAHARMHLREYVSDDDINMAIKWVSIKDNVNASHIPHISLLTHKYCCTILPPLLLLLQSQ